ncbi:MAG: serine hydrolase domain-containing protein [Clostridia bacterium]|nr:serine hydrolase domain-containing protein [Clostridia bacterium]
MNFERLTDYLDSLSGLNVPGCDLAVYQNHEPIYRHQAGFRDPENTQPMRGDETYFLYSCSKVFTTCAAMQLIEQGKMSLDDPVSLYLPAYAHLTVKDGDTVRPAKTMLTVRHLMSMQSGLNYDTGTPAVQKVMEENNQQATTRQISEAKAQDPLDFDPGTDFQYSFSHDVLGAVIEAASGQRFSEYLRDHIWEPLGIKAMAFHLNDDLQSRLCAQYHYNPEKYRLELIKPEDIKAMKKNPQFESGGGGLIGDTASYITFVDALASGGRGKNGAYILSPQMIQLWSANQLGPKSRKSFDGWKRLGYSYALGVRTRVNNRIGGDGPVGEFGWDGAAGAWAMIDPINRVSAFFGMHVMNYGYNYDVIHPNIRNLIYEGLKR